MQKKLAEFGRKAVVFAATSAPFATLAQGAPALPPAPATNAEGILGLLCKLAGWGFAFLVVLAILFILFAAFNYLTAQGDPEKVGKANQALLFSAVAIAVAVLARAVPALVGSVLGSSVTTSCS